MSRTCPNCDHVREAGVRDAGPGFVATPDWQCPACGVAYEKAAAARAHAQRQLLATAYTRTHVPGLRRAAAWQLWAAGAAIAALAWWGAGELADRGADIQDNALKELAASVGPGDLRIYTSSTCDGCDRARAWLDRHAIAYAECDVGEAACADELRALGATVVPHFVIRGRREMSGFHLLRLIGLLKA